MAECKTGKKRYSTEVEAMIKLNNSFHAQQKYGNRTTHKETRYYKCHQCKGWHLTSQIKKYNT